jgi:hypothetical protein
MCRPALFLCPPPPQLSLRLQLHGVSGQTGASLHLSGQGAPGVPGPALADLPVGDTVIWATVVEEAWLPGAVLAAKAYINVTTRAAPRGSCALCLVCLVCVPSVLYA